MFQPRKGPDECCPGDRMRGVLTDVTGAGDRRIMSDRMRISAKTLGKLAMADFCPRCFWTRMHMDGEPPFSIFPRIFNDIDGYTKRVVHGWFDDKGVAPPWLKGLGKLTGYINPPKSAKFNMPVGENVLLTGEADAILKLSGGSLVICDYKTAFCRGVDDPLYPIYVVQLNVYAALAEYNGLGKVSALALVYAEPCTGDVSARLSASRRDDGFALGFRAQILPIPLNTSHIPALAEAAWKIYDNVVCPAGREGCVDCAKLKDMNDTVKRVSASYACI